MHHTMQSAQCDPKELACQDRSGCDVHASTYDVYVLYTDCIYTGCVYMYIYIYTLYIYIYTKMVSCTHLEHTWSHDCDIHVHFVNVSRHVHSKRAHCHKSTSPDLGSTYNTRTMSLGTKPIQDHLYLDSDEFTFLLHSKQMTDKR